MMFQVVVDGENEEEEHESAEVNAVQRFPKKEHPGRDTGGDKARDRPEVARGGFGVRGFRLLAWARSAVPTFSASRVSFQSQVCA